LAENLVQTVRDNVEPLDRLGITILTSNDDPSRPDEMAAPVKEMIRNQFGAAGVIPRRFGRDMETADGALQPWLEHTHEKGLD
jgi:hypothetical protein